jgi:hypothetical protein
MIVIVCFSWIDSFSYQFLWFLLLSWEFVEAREENIDIRQAGKEK